MPQDYVKPLPSLLVQRYKGWVATTFEENRSWYTQLSEGGQHPRALLISCCDSRIHATSLFGADTGEFFIHRNIANLVPPYAPDSDHHGTSAAVEYAVRTLKVANVIILGHTGCGGVRGCYDMCSGNAPELEEKTSFVGRWMDILRPGYQRLDEGEDSVRVAQLEEEGIRVSLENLMGFPFVADAVKAGNLHLHGLVVDLSHGVLKTLHQDGTFRPV